MAVTVDTPLNLFVGAGDIYIDAAAAAATTDNNVFRLEREPFVPQLNGTKGPLVGTDYIMSSIPYLETSIAEISETATALQIAGSTSATVGATTTITEDDTRRLGTAAYHDYELRIPGVDGRRASFFVDNAIHTGNAEFTAQDDGLMAPRLTLAGRWDPSDLTAAPWRIEIEVAAS